MAGNRFNTDRMVSKEILDQLYNEADFFANDTDYISLKELLDSLDVELQAPLRMKPANPIDRTLTVQSGAVANPQHGRNRTPGPVNKQLIDAFTSNTLTFPAVSGGNITKTVGDSQVLTIPDDSYMKVGVHVNLSGELELSFGTPAASLAGAGAPAPIRKTWVVGFVVIRTVGSTVQNIDHADVYQYVGSGSGSGGSGDPIEISTDHQAEADQMILARSLRTGWYGSAMPEDNDYTGVAFSSKYNRLVMVSANGTNRVFYSDDLGESWSAANAPITAAWADVFWSPERELFIAIAGAVPMVSGDGINWFGGSAPSGTYTDVTLMSHLNRFIKVSTATTYAAYSDDGAIWTGATMGVGLYRSVAYSPTLQIAVAVGDSSNVKYSTDGITWSSGTLSGSYNIRSVIWASSVNKFIATSNIDVLSSTDGIAWTAGSALPVDAKLLRYSQKHNIFTAIGNSNNILTSTNGGTTFSITSRLPASLAAGDIEAVEWSEEAERYFIACDGAVTHKFFKAETLKHGPTYTSFTVSSGALDIAYSPTLNRFVCARPSAALAYSNDGITWTSSSGTYASAFAWVTVTWVEAAGHFLATANSGTAFARSTDGITWDDAETGITSGNWSAVGYAKGLNTIIYLRETTATRRSTNGGVTSVAGGTLPAVATSVAFSPKLGIWVACGLGTAAYSTTNGVSWTAASGVPAGGEYYSVDWSPELEMFVAIDASGTDTMYSTDGTTWAAVPTPPNTAIGTFARIKWIAERRFFMAVSAGTRRLHVSRDGLNWESYEILTVTNTWRSLAFGQNKIVVVGNNNTSGFSIPSDSDKGGTYVITLPAAPELGDTVKILDAENSFTDDPIIVAGNGAKIAGTTEDLILDVGGESVELVYSAESNNWAIK